MYEFIWDFGQIFYWLNVVGDDTYSINTKLGARTHSAWRYNAYIYIKNLKKEQLYENVKVIIFV